MTYAINSPYGGRASHSKGTTDNSVTYIMFDYTTEGINLTIHNINGEVV